MKTAYLFAGLPGSGKSTARKMAVSLTGGDSISAGTMLRQMAANDGLTDPTDGRALAHWVEEQRREQGPAFFAERVNGLVHRGELDVYYPLFIDSVRHWQEVVEFREAFGDVFLIWMSAPFHKRYERIVERGRGDESGFSERDLAERDNHELDGLGLSTIRERQDKIDYTVQNDGDLGNLKSAMDGILNR